MKYYYEIHVIGKNGFSTSIVSDREIDENEIIKQAVKEDKIDRDDVHYVDYTNELDEEEWNTYFK